MIKFLVSALFLVFVFFSYGQTCTQRLNESEDDYEAGRLVGIPAKLKNCLATKDGFTNEEAIRAQKLLTLVYIYTDEEDLAERSVIKLLNLDKEHSLDPQSDPIELQYLLDKFQYEPIFRISGKAGINKSFVNVIQEFGTFNTEATDKTYNNSSVGIGIGFTGEIRIERHFLKGFELGTGIQYRATNYTIDFSNEDTYSDNEEREVFGGQLIDKQRWIGVPVYVRFNLWYHHGRDFKPYVMLGVQPEYLLKSEWTETSRTGGTPFTLTDDIDAINFDQRNRFSFSTFAGVGAKFRFETHFITLEARYNNTLNYYNKPENKYANETVNFSVGYVEDDISIDYVTILVGWTHSIYNPKKRKEFR